MGSTNIIYHVLRSWQSQHRRVIVDVPLAGISNFRVPRVARDRQALPSGRFQDRVRHGKAFQVPGLRRRHDTSM